MVDTLKTPTSQVFERTSNNETKALSQLADDRTRTSMFSEVGDKLNEQVRIFTSEGYYNTILFSVERTV